MFENTVVEPVIYNSYKSTEHSYKKWGPFLFVVRNDDAFVWNVSWEPQTLNKVNYYSFCTTELRPELQCEITVFWKVPISLDLIIVSQSKRDCVK